MKTIGSACLWAGITLEATAALTYVFLQIYVRVRHDQIFTMTEVEIQQVYDSQERARAIEFTRAQFIKQLAIGFGIFLALLAISLLITLSYRGD